MNNNIINFDLDYLYLLNSDLVNYDIVNSDIVNSDIVTSDIVEFLYSKICI